MTTLRAIKGVGAPRPFTRERLYEIEPRFEADLVRGVIPRQGVVFLAGLSTSAKTFLALEFGLRVSRGEPVCGRRAKEAGVIYCAAEDAEGVRRRVKAWRIRNGDRGAFHMVPQAPDIRDPASLALLREEIRDAATEFDADGIVLGLIVFDTWAKVAPGADQNSSEDMGAAMANVAKLAVEFGCTILIVAHTPKDPDRGIAGWYGQFAGADAVVMLARDADDDALRVATIAKQKNGEDGARMAFRLEPVEIGVDEDKDTVTSCVLAFEDAPSRLGASSQSKLSDFEQIVLRAINHLIDRGQSEPAPQVEGVAVGTVAANIDAAKAQAFKTGFCTDDEPGGTVRSRWSRAIAGLVAKKQARKEGGLIWPV